MTQLRKVLSWGAPGSGKTAFGISSFWDYLNNKFVEKEGVIQTGRHLIIGGESAPDLDIPEEMVRRFPVDERGSLDFVDSLTKFLRNVAALHKDPKREAPMNLVIDGLSELNIDYVWGREKEEAAKSKPDKWATWRAWKNKCTEVLQLINPEVLGCNIFATARVSKFKSGVLDSDTGEIRGADPDYFDSFEYMPLMDGFWRDQIGHYFNFVVYHYTDYVTTGKGDKAILTPVYKSAWLPVGKYLVKNGASHKWVGAKHPAVLSNATWPQVQGMLEGFEGGKE